MSKNLFQKFASPLGALATTFNMYFAKSDGTEGRAPVSDVITYFATQSNATTQGNTFNGASQLVQMTAATKLPAVDGSLLTNIIASGFSGVLPIANGGTNSSTELNNNRIIQSSGGKIQEAPPITASRALASDTNGIPVASATTAAQLGYSSNVTSDIQAQLNSKQSDTLTINKIWIGNGSNVATEITVGGDITLNNSGTASINSGVIVNADVNNAAAIALTKLAALTASRVPVTSSSGFIVPSAVTDTELSYLSGVTDPIQSQLNAKAPLSSPALINIPTTPTADPGTDTIQIASCAFANAAAAAAASGATGTALQKSSNLSDLTNAGTARTNIGLGNVDNTSDANKPVSTAQQTALDSKANLASPTFTGTLTADTATTVTVPTASGGDVSTKAANTTFVSNAISTAASANFVERLLSTTNGIDLTLLTKQNLFTVPGSKSCVITKIIARNASATLTTAAFGFGFNASANDVITAATHAELTSSAMYSKIVPIIGAAVGAAASVFGVQATIAAVGATTISVDVYGYTF